MRLKFNGGTEFVIFDIDRKNKKLILTSSRTNYSHVPLEWKMLFDKGSEKLQEEATDNMDDNEFISTIESKMKSLGYNFIK